MLPSNNSGNNYTLSNNRKLFSFENDEEDVDDETFLKNSRHSISQSKNSPHFNNLNPQEQRVLELQRKRELIEERTLASTVNSLNLLRESEQVGIATAVELSEQREKLERTSRNLDEINASLRTTQKHIDSIKSVFGGLKNYFRPPAASTASSSSNSTFESQPSSTQATLAPAFTRSHDSSYGETNSVGTHQERIDRNLTAMSSNLSSLKELALNLGSEVMEQNQLLDDMQYKAENAEFTTSRQNTQMNRILGKK